MQRDPAEDTPHVFVGNSPTTIVEADTAFAVVISQLPFDAKLSCAVILKFVFGTRGDDGP